VTGLGARTARLDSGRGLSPFTGRDRELAELRRMLEIVVNGEGQVAGLAGDPGLGKSRLAWEFCRLAEDDAAVLEGRCRSYGAAIAYLPLFELVRNACGIAADDAPDLVATKIERKIKTLELDVSQAHYLRHAFGLPTGDPAVAALDPVAIRARTFEALSRLLVAEAGHRPLVVLIEDLHWIDRTSEEFLAGFVDELPSAPIMLLVTYRPGYPPPWPAKSFTSQLALRPLSSVASEKIVASILDVGNPAAATAIAERGEGNPFFLEELARATRDQVADEQGVAVPQTVQQVLAARIDRLTADQKAALQVAAVLGREFSLDLAEEVWDGDVPLEARLQELKGLEFLRERHGGAERIFVFTHALTREVAYDGMLEARRRELHGRAGASFPAAGVRRPGRRAAHRRADGAARAGGRRPGLGQAGAGHRRDWRGRPDGGPARASGWRPGDRAGARPGRLGWLAAPPGRHGCHRRTRRRFRRHHGGRRRGDVRAGDRAPGPAWGAGEHRHPRRCRDCHLPGQGLRPCSRGADLHAGPSR